MPLFEFLAYPLADGITLVFLGILLGRLVGTDSRNDKKIRIGSGYLIMLATSDIFCSCDLWAGLFPVQLIHASGIRFSYLAKRIPTGICRLVREVFDGYLIRGSRRIYLREEVNIQSRKIGR